MSNAVVPGRTDVTTRALERTVSAISAQRLGVPVREVSVELGDDRGRLGIRVAAPVRLDGLRADGEQTGLVSGAQDARGDIRESVTEITGRQVGDLSLRITRATIAPQRRVL